MGGLRGPVSLTLTSEASATNFVAYLNEQGEPEYATYNGLNVIHRDPGKPTLENGQLSMRREQVLHIGKIEDLAATRANPPFAFEYKDETPGLGHSGGAAFA